MKKINLIFTIIFALVAMALFAFTPVTEANAATQQESSIMAVADSLLNAPDFIIQEIVKKLSEEKTEQEKELFNSLIKEKKLIIG